MFTQAIQTFKRFLKDDATPTAFEYGILVVVGITIAGAVIGLAGAINGRIQDATNSLR